MMHAVQSLQQLNEHTVKEYVKKVFKWPLMSDFVVKYFKNCTS